MVALLGVRDEEYPMHTGDTPHSWGNASTPIPLGSSYTY